MEAVINIQNLEKELLQIERVAWMDTQIDKMEELREVVDHFRAMPIIIKFHILIGNLQKSRKKTQQPKRGVQFWDQAYQEIPTTTEDTLLNLPILFPQTETPTRPTGVTSASIYQDTGG